ncbi:complement C2 isoform X2 [Bombina bombina]|nr:complement C2 isoform X2 [Bombina bombina]
MKSSTGRTYTQIKCYDMRCPPPGNFENGEYSPRKDKFVVGENITFFCNDGYTLRGSVERTCRRNARWSGVTAVCDDQTGSCPDPGVPMGAIKTGIRYNTDEKVRYECSQGMTLMGTQERKCQEVGRWSGTEVSCHYPYSFDLPEDVEEQFKSSIAGILNTEQKRQKTFGRTIKVKLDGILNVYLLLDASKSVGEINFEIFKSCATELVQGITEFDMKVEFGILSFATQPNVIISTFDQQSANTENVLELIETELLYSKHKVRSGTNTKGALETVFNMTAQQKTRYNETVWNSIHHVIILLTDGKSNEGGRPSDAIKRIKDQLNIKQNREDFLDVYVFGVDAEKVDKVELNEIASQKDNEKHVFILNSTDELKTVFPKILKIDNYGDMCGLNDESDADKKRLHHPWIVQIEGPTTTPCMGSLISGSWVLYAAHCVRQDIPANKYSVKIGEASYGVERIEMHECYKLDRKNSIGIKEDYDYDVALLKLQKAVVFGKEARPICIPCTESTNRALKMSEKSTCKQHRDQLFRTSKIDANFISKGADELEELSIIIKMNKDKDGCVSPVTKSQYFKNVKNPYDVVTPQMLCAEGAMSCKGESGGPVFVNERNRRRFIQVGIISWGLVNPCKNSKKGKRKGASYRDFHTSVIEILPFLHKYAGDELNFLPDVKTQANPVCPA